MFSAFSKSEYVTAKLSEVDEMHVKSRRIPEGWVKISLPPDTPMLTPQCRKYEGKWAGVFEIPIRKGRTWQHFTLFAHRVLHQETKSTLWIEWEDGVYIILRE